MDHRIQGSLFLKLMSGMYLIIIPALIIAFGYDYSKGKEPVIWGLLVSILGLALFIKAKASVIKKGKLISFGVDPMDQKNTWLYFFGWVLMIGGYFLSWI